MIEMGLFKKEWALSPRPETIPAWDSLKDEEKSFEDLRMAIYAAMVDRMDQAIGRVLAKVKELGQENNTLTIALTKAKTEEGSRNRMIMTEMCPTAVITPLASAVSPVPDKVPCAIPDRQDFQQPCRVHLTGWTGSRMEVSETNRLVKIDPNRLLLSYYNRPGCQSYDGEHIGKWLHAASLAWNNSGDPALRQKLDTVAALRQNKMLPKLRQRMIFGCAINMLPKVCEDLALQMVDLSLKREGVDVQTQLGQEGLFGLIDLG